MSVANLYDSKANKYRIYNNLDYYKCMEFYLSSKEDNETLKAYLENKKNENSITDKELEFWENAMESGTVEEICRTAIVEANYKDRRKDPLKVKAARAIFKTNTIVEEDKKVQEETGRGYFKAVYGIGYAVKEIISQKMKNKDKSIEEILDNINEDELEQKENDAYGKMKSFMDKIRGRASKSGRTTSQEFEYYKIKIMGETARTICEYDTEQMEKYVEKYLKQKNAEIDSSEKEDNSDCGYKIDTKIYEGITMSEIRDSKQTIRSIMEFREKEDERESNEGESK